MNSNPPRFVVLEGVDGAGKTTLFRALSAYYGQFFSNLPLYTDSFPGSHQGTLGEWVYRFHHNRVTRAPSTAKVSQPAVQLMHIAAHVDTIVSHIAPTLNAGGNVILDRYWWSTYAYSRPFLTREQTTQLIAVERMFWAPLVQPTIIYVTRQESMKPYQLTSERHKLLDKYYHEIIEQQRTESLTVHELPNDGPISMTWKRLLSTLGLPYMDLENINN